MIEINNLTNEKIKEIDELNDYTKYLISYMKIDASFSVIIIDNKKIHEINKEYRGIDRPTDVISFALEEGETFDEPYKTLGDIYISIFFINSMNFFIIYNYNRHYCILYIHIIK